jgi:hypothetical protein
MYNDVSVLYAKMAAKFGLGDEQLENVGTRLGEFALAESDHARYP